MLHDNPSDEDDNNGRYVKNSSFSQQGEGSEMNFLQERSALSLMRMAEDDPYW